MIDLYVPTGISFLMDGTITVQVPLLNFWWLPFWLMSLKPFLTNTETTSLEDGSLVIKTANSFPLQLGL